MDVGWYRTRRDADSRDKRTIAVRPSFLLVAAAVTALASCSSDGRTASGAAPESRQSPRIPVAVATVESRSVPIELTAIGTAQAYSVVEIRPQVTGELTTVDFREGDDVRKGQVLFTLRE